MDYDNIFRRRGYLHFDAPLMRAKLEKKLINPQSVERWRFLPLLLAKMDKSKVISRTKDNKPFIKQKVREICTASHADATLYGYYAFQLDRLYEPMLVASGLENAVTAFRTLSKSNVHFANDAFQWIRQHRPCVALAFDVENFFGSLDHGILKRKWSELLGATTLPNDHHQVFQGLTKYSFVEKEKAFAALGISKHNPRAGGRVRLCDSKRFRKAIAPLIEKNKTDAGIPQGTPISALLSNVYLFDFDVALNDLIGNFGGFYRRYCDDILCVVAPEHQAIVEAAVLTEIAKLKLVIHQKKSTTHKFLAAGQIVIPPLQYLGLTFDGEKARLRPSGIGRYYSKMRAGVRAAMRARDRVAEKEGKAKSTVPIFKKEILQKFSHLGTRNFVTYAKRAAVISDSDAITKQVRRHWPQLIRNIRKKQMKP